MNARYPGLFEKGILHEKVRVLRDVLKHCTLCPRLCGVDRTEGEQGFCLLSEDAVISHALAHFGEEPPVSGTEGAGTIFFSSCNLRCVYCQNYQISHQMLGTCIDAEALARVMVTLQDEGCHNIECVTPTPHVPRIVEALAIACERGLRIPLVYNCGGYENPDIVRMLDGIVDVYMPDFKYGNDRDAYHLSGVRDYASWAVCAVKEMVRQVGASLEVEDGVVRRGIIIRHLLLPGHVRGSLEVLRLIKEHCSTSCAISIMAQYVPMTSVAHTALLGRRVTQQEYEVVVNGALDMGFDHVFVQDIDEKNLVPDFMKETPFQWTTSV